MTTVGDEPLWKAPLRLIHQRLVPAINDFTRSEEFAALTAIRHRSTNVVGRYLERTSRRALHLANLPAASDVNRLLTEIAKLEREVRTLRKQLSAESPTTGD